jgi:pimeloyl-ACP methyl ester carboxylesterase
VGEWTLTKTYPSVAGEVRWQRLGDTDRQPIVLLHGTPFSSFIWRNIAPALAARTHVYVWDIPGYGSSEKFADQDLSLDMLCHVFVELLDHWNLTAPTVVAHDSGGAIALGAHLRHHVDYRKLALVDAVALAPWGSAFFAIAGEHTDAFSALPAPLHQALIRAYLDSASSRGLHPQVLDSLVAPWLGEHGQEHFYRQLTWRAGDQHYTDQLRPAHESINIPVTVCWGSDDSWIPVDRGRELVARIPDARLEIITEAGHLSPEDNPAALTAALLGFVYADQRYS